MAVDAGLAGLFVLSAAAGAALAVGVRRRRADAPAAGYRKETAHAALAAAGGAALVWDGDEAPALLGRAPTLAALRAAFGLAPDADGADVARALAGAGAHDALRALRQEGTPFETQAFGFRVAGAPAGPATAVFLRPATDAAAAEALGAAPFLAWSADGEGRLTWANAAYLRAVEAQSLADARARDLQLDAAAAQEARAAARGGPVSAERALVIEGRRRVLTLTYHPAAGGAIATAFDATAAAEARDALTRESRAYAETLNHLTDAVAIFGPDKRLVFYNDAFVKLWELDPAFLRDAPTHGGFLDEMRARRRLPPRADFAAFKSEELDVYVSAATPADSVWTLPDGRSLRVARQRQPSGGLLLLFEDISDTLLLQARFKTLIDVQRATLDGLREGVAVFSGDGRLTLWNESFAALWRLKAAELGGEPDFAAVASACARLFPDEEAWRSLKARVTDPSPHARRETNGEMARTDDTIVAFQTKPLPDGATLIAFTDMTDARRAEDALRDRAAAFQAADQIKTDFVRNMSYQLRTPLTTIMGYSELLAAPFSEALTTGQAERVGAIRGAADQLDRLITNMLDLAMIDAGKLELDLGDVRLSDILAEAGEHGFSALTSSQVTITVDAPEDLGVIRADRTRLRQVLFSMVANAMDHVQPGDAVTVGARRVGDSVQIYVADTGRELDAERQAAAFDSIGAEDDYRGAGIRLALVKRFVELHGGWVAMVANPGGGVKVVCHLPADAARHAAAPELRLSA